MTSLERAEDHRWNVVTDAGRLTADNVVVATGTNSAPRLPTFASALDQAIAHLRSSAYRRPSTLLDGDVLVVGAGTSGAEIALELAETHRVYLAGRPTVHIPDLLLRRAGALYWQFVNSVLTRDTPIGRRAATGFERRGAPLIRVSMPEVERAGVTRLPRIEGIRNGMPVTQDGRTILVRTVVWATGYRDNFSWIRGIDLQSNGRPKHSRGVVSSAPGLYLLGIPFQYALTSGLLGGVGRDAAYLAERISADRNGAEG